MLEFELDGRRVVLAARTPASREFRVLVDGVVVPMEVARTKTYTGNIGTHTREVEAQHPAEWIRIEGNPWEPYREPEIQGAQAVRIFFQLPSGSIYNTWVWRCESVRLKFTTDFSRVAIVCDESIDTSS